VHRPDSQNAIQASCVCSVPDLRDQYEQLCKWLRTARFDQQSDELWRLAKWLRLHGKALTGEEVIAMRALMCVSFGIEDAALEKVFEQTISVPKKPVVSFESLIPKTGWFNTYMDYAAESEAPGCFHFLSALSILGVALGRRTWLDKGYYQIFPNFAITLLAPSGEMKTSAANIAMRILDEANLGTCILQDKATPEALVLGLQSQTQAVGLMYAPELSVFLGKQRYNEGMIPLLTSLFDAPKTWKSTTIMRGECILSEVALSALFCSTPDWFSTAIPRDAFGGGFMSRILFCYVSGTDRCMPWPDPSYEQARRPVCVGEFINAARGPEGEMTLTPQAKQWYDTWYRSVRTTPPPSEKMRGYYRRKQDHLLRLAMVLHLSNNGGLVLGLAEIEQSLSILDWLEKSSADVLESVGTTTFNEKQTKILMALTAASGEMTYSALMQKTRIYFKSTEEFKDSIKFLEASGEIKDLPPAAKGLGPHLVRKVERRTEGGE